MGEVTIVDNEVVIIGAGICGLATAVALHKNGIKSIVMERSESLRNITGAAIRIRQNGWRALDQLGVADTLRPIAVPIQRERILGLDDEGWKEQETSIKGETRCLRRKDLIDTLYAGLPPATVKFGCKLESLKLDPNTTKLVLRFIDGSFVTAKVVIGCDGDKSIVANFLNLKPTKTFPFSEYRGLSNYPNGHSFDYEFTRFRKHDNLIGRIPIDDKLVYWFITQPYLPKGEGIWDDPESIRRTALALVNDYPQEIKEMIKIADENSLSIAHLRYRSPWELLTGSFCKGRVAVAGDAMHVMGPFLGQSGSAALEDAVVLARNMAQVGLDHVEEAFDLYVKERRMRVVRLSFQTSLFGMLLGASSCLKKLMYSVLLSLLFRNPSGHDDYDCGGL